MKHPFCLTSSFSVLLSVFCLAEFSRHADAQTVLISDVRVFDGSDFLDPQDVLLSDGKIVALGQDLDTTKLTADTTRVNGSGKTLIPALIDCHTHTFSGQHLQQAAWFGVGTELDMMAMPSMAAALRKQSGDSSQRRAQYRSAGAAVTVPNGHGTQFGFPVPTLTNASDSAEFVQARVNEGSDYIKLIYEDGSAYGFTRPTLTKEMFELSVEAAHEHDRIAVAHVSTLEGAQIAFDAGIDGLVHLFCDEPITDELIQLAKKKGIFVVPTASIVSNASGSNLTSQIREDEALNPLLAPADIANLEATFPLRPGLSSSWKILRENISRLHAAGVPILAGTDAPNPGTVHGVSMHQELRMLVECGLTPAEALAAATSVPAEYFQLSDRGRIEVGLRADLVLCSGNVENDIADAAHIEAVWIGGVEIDRAARLRSIAKANAPKPMSNEQDGRIISDFEGERPEASFGAGWSASTDVMMGGSSTVEFKTVQGGAAGTKRSLAVAGKTREQQPAFSGVMFAPGDAPMQPTDLSQHDSISFWAQGDDRDYQIMLFFQKRGFQPSMKTFRAASDWQRYEFKISDFDECDGTDILGIWFGSGAPGDFKFQIDEVQLQK